MAFRYTIPEISAIPLLTAAEEQDGICQIYFDATDASREYLVKWTQQDDCPMFHQAMKVLLGEDSGGRPDRNALSDVFVYIDFAGIFDRKPVGKVADLQRKAEWMFRPEGIQLALKNVMKSYVAFERSASMSRNSKLCFVRKDIYKPLKERMMLGMTIGQCRLSKLYAYNGLLFTGGRRIDSGNLLNNKRIIVIDNPKSIIPNVKTITVEDDGSNAPVREYHRVEKRMDIEVTEFDGEGLVSPRMAQRLDPLNYKGHPHHSFQIRLPYIKGVVHEVDFGSLFIELGIHKIVDIWGKWHSIEDVDMILTKSMFKGFGWMMENNLSWVEYLRRCLKYDHALYISGMDSVKPQDMTELNYQFLNTAAISDEEFRPAAVPKNWNYSRQAHEGHWLTKATEQAYYDFRANLGSQLDYFAAKLDDPELEINDRRRYRAQLIEKNFFFLFEPMFQRELRDKAKHILDKYCNANLLVPGDNRYLSDDLMRLLAVIVQPVSKYAYNVLMAEAMSGAVFYAPKPAYEPNDMYTLLRNPHIARNEEVIAKPMIEGPLRQKYLGHLHYVVMVDSRSLIPERLGGADYDGDMIKTISDPLMNKCVARNYGDNYENEGNLPLLKIPAAEPILADAQDWKARFETVKATFSSRVGQISNAALRRSIIAYDENSTSEEREQCRQETEVLAILTGLEIDSAKSGIKPDLSAYLGGGRGKKSLFLRYKSISQKNDSRKWYQPTKKERMDTFFGSVDWGNVSSNLEKLPYYARAMEEKTKAMTARPVTDGQLFPFAADPGWQEKLDPNVMERMKQLIADYEEAQRRCRYLRIEPNFMTRKSDIQRILYSRNQEEEYSVDELYSSLDNMFPHEFRRLRFELTEGGWMFARPEERLDFFDHLPAQSIRYWELFCDFRNGGYRLLPDIVCDYDDMYSQKERRKQLTDRKGDSEDLRWMMHNIDKEGDYREELIRRCIRCMHPMAGQNTVDFTEAAKCAIALGKRQFALEVLPGVLLELAENKRPEETRSKRKWRWPWDAE